MNQVITYHFTIKALSPIYFGDSEEDLITNADNQPMVLGNALGGAFREYLRQTTISEDSIREYMGGPDPNKEQTGEEKETERFIDSLIYISDGKITCDTSNGIKKKEGTAVDPAYGTAKDNHKYSLNYLPAGTELSFDIECNEWVKIAGKKKQEITPLEFEKLIGTWSEGIDTQNLLLGGQKSNGFGKFKLEKLEKTVFSFNNINDLDEYIFNHNTDKKETVDWKKIDKYIPKENRVISISMTGKFPYGLYQGFKVEHDDSNKYELSGLQEKEDQEGKKDNHNEKKAYYLPSTSLKGLIRNEVNMLIKRITKSDELAKQKNNELFGSTEQKGKLIFSDVEIAKGEKVEIERFEKKEDGETITKKGHPIYNKIDRLTGSVFSSALKHQQEIQGEANIQFDLMLRNEELDSNPYLFPIIYVMRRIGNGWIPLGGRTVIGLGQFEAGEVSIKLDNYSSYEIETDTLSNENKEWLERQFDSFIRWCNNEHTQSI